VAAIPTAQVLTWSGATGTYRELEFNLRRPLLADRRVREALVRVIDRSALVPFEEGFAVPQYALMVQGNIRWVNPAVERYDYDPERAAALLEEAGFHREGEVRLDRTGQVFQLELLWPTTSPARQRIAQYLQEQWRTLGIEVTSTGVGFTTFGDRTTRQPDFDLALGSYYAALDPDGMTSLIHSEGFQNATGYSNPRIDQLLEEAATEADEARRVQLYGEVQQIVGEDLPLYVMTTLENVTALDQRVGGVTPRQGGDLLGQNNLQVLDWFLRDV
jgi:peptide/nickel transport system substrate-binding protein